MLRNVFRLFAACSAALWFALPLAVSADSPPKTPHKIEGREDCVMCHKVGGIGVDISGGVGMPDNHLSRGNSICLSCHPSAKGEVLPSTVVQQVPANRVSLTTAPTSTPAAQTPTVSASSPSSGTASGTVTVQATALPLALAQKSSASPDELPSAGEPWEDFNQAKVLFAGAALLVVAAIVVDRVAQRR